MIVTPSVSNLPTFLHLRQTKDAVLLTLAFPLTPPVFHLQVVLLLNHVLPSMSPLPTPTLQHVVAHFSQRMPLSPCCAWLNSPNSKDRLLPTTLALPPLQPLFLVTCSQMTSSSYHLLLTPLVALAPSLIGFFMESLLLSLHPLALLPFHPLTLLTRTLLLL